MSAEEKSTDIVSSACGVTCSGTSSTGTVIIEETEQQPIASSRIVLRLKKPKAKKKVGFTEGTVDNEGMDKKKSKCCCIYEKPRVFGESSSESDDECENCQGHPEGGHGSDPPTPPPVPPV